MYLGEAKISWDHFSKVLAITKDQQIRALEEKFGGTDNDNFVKDDTNCSDIISSLGSTANNSDNIDSECTQVVFQTI